MRAGPRITQPVRAGGREEAFRSSHNRRVETNLWSRTGDVMLDPERKRGA